MLGPTSTRFHSGCKCSHIRQNSTGTQSDHYVTSVIPDNYTGWQESLSLSEMPHMSRKRLPSETAMYHVQQHSFFCIHYRYISHSYTLHIIIPCFQACCILAKSQKICYFLAPQQRAVKLISLVRVVPDALSIKMAQTPALVVC